MCSPLAEAYRPARGESRTLCATCRREADEAISRQRAIESRARFDEQRPALERRQAVYAAEQIVRAAAAGREGA